MKTSFPSLHKTFYQSLDDWLQKNSRKSKKAVYVVKSKTPVPRVLKIDKGGILYVGETSDFTDRVGKLVNAMNGTELRKHDAGDDYFRLLSKVYKLNNVSIEVIFTSDHNRIETQLLQQYLNKFGELPPLNRKG